ncbi:MAG: GNAT family N-acetyltransferase [Crocinitomicaceae bacterium]|nr:GNAT family N-acetyltransferase [Crocinitomicaceae bacterium]
MQIRPIRFQDRSSIAKLYRLVSGTVRGISRRPEEITETWIFSLINKPEKDLVGIVATVEDEEGDERIVAVAHAERNELACYSHILQDFTIIVHPDHQGTGVGRQLGFNFLMHISKNYSDIKRLEMVVRKELMHHNTYVKAGFKLEAEVEGRIRNADGSFSDSMMLVWINPNYKP